MKLYYASGACSLASHIALHEIGQEVEYVKTDIRAKRTEAGEDYLSINPLGYVPALQLDNGEVLTENAAILPYIASLKPGVLSPHGDALGEARVHEALGFLGTELHKAFGPFFGPLEDEAREKAQAKLDSRIDHVERLLGDGREYLLAGRFTVADAYAFVILNWSSGLGLSLDRWPNVQAFVQRIAQRPSVRQALVEEGLLEPA
jgi:glutathione S-transferase